MRKMIPAKQAKGLEKLNENIVINDDGTQVEIGGNIAVESIEQLGYLGTIPGTNSVVKATLEYQQVKYVTISRNVNVSECVFTGNAWTEAPYDGRININDNECLIAEDQAAGKWCIAVQPPYDGENHPTKVFYLNQGNVGSVTLDANAEIGSKATDFSGFVPGVPEHIGFLPFFTEEQYEALLALIENA